MADFTADGTMRDILELRVGLIGRFAALANCFPAGFRFLGVASSRLTAAFGFAAHKWKLPTLSAWVAAGSVIVVC